MIDLCLDSAFISRIVTAVSRSLARELERDMKIAAETVRGREAGRKREM